MSWGARTALAATAVAGLVLGASAGWWAITVLAGVPLVLALRQQSRRSDGESTEDPAATGRAESLDRPPPRAGAFQERQALKDLIALFDTRLRGGVVVLQGLAGVGKTQLAAEYARRVRKNVVWIDASSRDSILRGLSRAAAAILGANDRDVRWAADRMLDWLDRTDQPWLVVLDDLRDPHDMDGLWPPPHGQIVVTTELRGAVDTLYVSDVGPFEREEAIAFLTERLARYPHQCVGAAELADAMGHYPLVLDLAAAHIAAHLDMTCTKYLALFNSQADGLPRDHWDTIAATWSLSIERTRGLARHVLALASFLHAHGIPSDVFTSAATRRYLRTATGHAVGEQDVRNTLSRLHCLGLITYDPGAPTPVVRMHALVQRVVRTTMTPREVARTVRAVADTLLRIWPPVENDGGLGATLRANAMALRNVVGLGVWDRRVRALWSRLGFSLGESGQIEAARYHFLEVFVACLRLFGPRGHFTLHARLCLAHWQGADGDPAGAVSALKLLIREAPRTFRFQRRLILKARLALARWLCVARDPVCALAEADSLLDELRQTGDPATLYARNIRARCLALLGRSGEAINEMVALVDEFRRQKSADDLDTLSARNNLATLRHKAGDHTTAIAEFSALLPDLCRVLDPCHPKTLCTRNNLTRCRIDAGDPAMSIPEARQLVADCDRVFGPSHPETLVAWDNLSRVFAKACG
jgi:hypothetical protein